MFLEEIMAITQLYVLFICCTFLYFISIFLFIIFLYTSNIFNGCRDIQHKVSLKLNCIFFSLLKGRDNSNTLGEIVILYALKTENRFQLLS